MMISKAAKLKACELLGEETVRDAEAIYDLSFTPFAQFIQDVSDTLLHFHGKTQAPQTIARFILPEPADPLVEALDATHLSLTGYRDTHADRTKFAACLREELELRGLKIVEGA